VRNAAPTATVLPFPGPHSSAAAAGAGAGAGHAGPPPGLDPAWAEAAAEEGVVAYKNLLGPGQNMSHVPGADVEGGEITTVADQVNFEVGGGEVVPWGGGQWGVDGGCTVMS
jgi:hypothetical protein